MTQDERAPLRIVREDEEGPTGALRTLAVLEQLCGSAEWWRGTLRELGDVTRTGFSERTLRAHMRVLTAAGVVSWVKAGGRPGTVYLRLRGAEAVAAVQAKTRTVPEVFYTLAPEVPEVGTPPTALPAEPLSISSSSSSSALPEVPAVASGPTTTGRLLDLGVRPDAELVAALDGLERAMRETVLGRAATYGARTPAYVWLVIESELIAAEAEARKQALSRPADALPAARLRGGRVDRGTWQRVASALLARLTAWLDGGTR